MCTKRWTIVVFGTADTLDICGVTTVVSTVACDTGAFDFTTYTQNDFIFYFSKIKTTKNK